jgi:hypothetical protein
MVAEVMAAEAVAAPTSPRRPTRSVSSPSHRAFLLSTFARITASVLAGSSGFAIWLAFTALATELLAFTARLALPITAALYEPKRLRLPILVHDRLLSTLGTMPLSAEGSWSGWARILLPPTGPAT